MSEVTALVREQTMKIFSPKDAELVIADLGTMNFADFTSLHPAERDRIHLAILHYSEGNLGRFDIALRQAKVDWRDVLVGDSLGDANWREVLLTRGIDISRLGRV